MDKKKNDLLYWLIGLLFTIYLIIRAVVIPVTIDEAGTFFNAVPRSVWDIITYVDPVPNNHIVNTLLIKLFVNIFGVHALVIRLPNILGFILFFSIAVIWLKKINANSMFIFCGLFLLTCNPYLLDFFALARGYGLSIAFMFVSLYYSYLFIGDNKLKYLSLSFGLAALSVYSNFTLLNFYLALSVLTVIIILQKHWNQPLKKAAKECMVIFSISILLLILCYLPLYRIVSTNQLQYWDTNGFYTDTLMPLVKAMQYTNELFPLMDGNFYVVLYIILFFIIGICAIAKTLRKKFNFSDNYLGFSFLILAGTLSCIVLQFYILGTPMLNPRGAIFLYVLFVLPFLFLLNELFNKAKIIQNTIILPLIFIAVFHFCSTANFESCREWWFDANTKQVLSLIESAPNQTSSNISLNTGWLFNGSFQFHVLEQHYEDIKLAPYHKEIWADSVYTYYYCERSDFPELEKNYNIYKSYGNGSRLLLKRREE